MIHGTDLATGLDRIQRTKAKRYTDGQREEIGRQVLDWDLERWREAVDHVIRTHETQTLPTPAHFVKAGGGSRRGSTRTWDQEATGSTKSEPGRPHRIGENLGASRRFGDADRIAYYESMIQHMTKKDRDSAKRGEDSIPQPRRGDAEPEPIGEITGDMGW